MAKYIKTKDIDGVKIIVGFDSPQMDPVATEKKVVQLMANGPEAEEIDRLVDAEAPAGEVAAAVLKFHKRSRRLYFETPVLMGGGGYLEVDEKKWKDLVDRFYQLSPRQFLTPENVVVDDHRGAVVFFKDGSWKMVKLEKLGQSFPEGGKLKNQLNESEAAEISMQARREAIRSMPAEQVAREKSAALENAARAAAIERSAYEIDGRLDPLGDARKWFSIEKARIEELYNVG